MRIYKGNAELVFRGRVAPWYGTVSGLVAVAVAVIFTLPVRKTRLLKLPKMVSLGRIGTWNSN